LQGGREGDRKKGREGGREKKCAHTLPRERDGENGRKGGRELLRRLCGQTLRSFFVVGASRCVCLSAPPPLACATAGYSQLRVSRHNALVASYRRARALSLSLDDCTKRDSSMVFSQVVQIIIIITTTPYLQTSIL